MIRKRNSVGRTLFAVAVLSLTVFQAQAQIQPASSQTDFYFAHVTDGGPPEGDKWTTQFRFVNPNDFPVTGTLQFFSTNGAPLEVQFGTISSSFWSVPIPANGSIQAETTGSSPTLRTGFAQGSFDAPIQATSEFRNSRNGVFANGASVDGIAPNQRFWTFADAYTGIAIANPNASGVSCTGTFRDSNGVPIRQTPIFLGPFSQTAYTLWSFLFLPLDTVGSYRIDCPSSPVVSLAIAGNDRGITSSLPPGAFAFPPNHAVSITKIFKHLLKTWNDRLSPMATIHPQLVVETSFSQPNASASSTNVVTIGLSLAKLLADSPSELAFVIAHELGHIYQFNFNSGFYYPCTIFSTNLSDEQCRELDADVFATFVILFAGYDPYAGAGTLGKSGMLSKRTDLWAQWEDLLSAPHTTFVNRMDNILGAIEYVCSRPDAISFCQDYHDNFHPHLAAPLSREPPPDQLLTVAPGRE